MTILINQRRTSQPQYPCGIDWENPITRNLLLAFDGVNVTDATGNARLTASNITKTAGFTGVGCSTVTAAGTGIIQLPANDRYRLVNTPCTIFAFGKPSQTDTGIHSIWSVRDGTTQVSQLTVDMSASATMNFTRGGATATPLLITNRLEKTWYALAMDAASTEMYTNGQSSNNNAGGVFTTSTIQPALMNRQSGGRGWAGSMYLTLLFERKLAAAEIISLSANPWQIFNPQVS